MKKVILGVLFSLMFVSSSVFATGPYNTEEYINEQNQYKSFLVTLNALGVQVTNLRNQNKITAEQEQDFWAIILNLTNNIISRITLGESVSTSLGNNSSTVNTQNWKIYRNEKYGYEFKYPSNWIVDLQSDKEIHLSNSSGDGITVTYEAKNKPLLETDSPSIVQGVVQDFDNKFGNVSYFYNEQEGKWKQSPVNENNVDLTVGDAKIDWYTNSNLPILYGKKRWATYIVPLSKITFLKLNISGSGTKEPLLDVAKTVKNVGLGNVNYNYPIINSIDKSSGPVGTIVTLKGVNLAGFEGDFDAWIENSVGERGFLRGIYTGPVKEQQIKVQITEKVCKQNTGYSGLPCTSYLTITPGVYKIYTSPWGKNSNKINFVVTDSSNFMDAKISLLNGKERSDNRCDLLSFSSLGGYKVSKVSPLRDIINVLLTTSYNFKDGSEFTNVLGKQALLIDDISIKDRVAIIKLSGKEWGITSGSDCARYSVFKQIKNTALQFSTVDEVWIYINNEQLKYSY